MLARVFEMNRRMAARQAQADGDAIRRLYTADSFSSPEKMGRAARAVRRLLEDNRRIAAEMRLIVDHVRTRVSAARWPEADKRQFWEEMAEGFTGKYQIRAELLELLRDWVEATLGLYEFVLSHSENLRFDGNKVRARNADIGSEFASKLAAAKKSRAVFRQAAARLDAEQSDLFRRWGLAAPGDTDRGAGTEGPEPGP